jgi:SAM-dependent methyltransferase
MSASIPDRDAWNAYLCVDSFIKTLFDARALATAFETGLVDFMLQTGRVEVDSLATRWSTDRQAMRLLVALLVANRVVEERDGQITLTEGFLEALQFRDLLQLKVQMANFAAHDFLDYFSDLICRPDHFMKKSNFTRLFDYGRCFEPSKDNYERTKQWMRITSTLTKFEAQGCLAHHDFGCYGRMLDIGGNSGEFVLRICRKHPAIQATVFDLPLVCDIGMEHVRSESEANRIAFVKGNALSDELPTGFDLVTFKSMLHDWPEKEAREFIAKASQALKPGGTLLIFERGPIEVDEGALPYSAIPMLLFFRSFRGPSLYREQLGALGFQNITVQRIDLEMPFYLVTGVKP